GTMENRYEIRLMNPGQDPQVTIIDMTFNGYDLHLRSAVNGILQADTTIGYSLQLKIQDDGKLTYENSIIQGLLGVRSMGEDNWYWLDTDKKKARVYLGAALLFPTTAGLTQIPSGQNLPTAGL